MKLYKSKEDDLTDINLNDIFSEHNIPKLNKNESDNLEGLFNFDRIIKCP